MREKLDLSGEIDFSAVTACGETCTGCPKIEAGICRGCIAQDGYVPEWADSGRCKIHACAREHGAAFCGLCPEFPCQKVPELVHWNPRIVEHLDALRKKYHEQKEQYNV